MKTCRLSGRDVSGGSGFKERTKVKVEVRAPSKRVKVMVESMGIVVESVTKLKELPSKEPKEGRLETEGRTKLP